jgi:predicted ATP-grasp superfamily ATP-dependent carboligase
VIDFYRYTDKELQTLLKSIVIISDSREQQADHITKWFDEKKIPHITQKN